MNALFVPKHERDAKAPLHILHVSGDYPDSFEAFKTPVIKSLVEMTRRRFVHEVYSLNRRAPSCGPFAASVLRGGGKPRLELRQQPFEDGTAFEYFAPGRGVFHATMLHQLGDRLAQQLASEGRHPDLVVGHKLGIEGIAARRMARTLDIPFAITIQGNTDTRILRMRPDLAGELGRVFHEAAVVFAFAPWAMNRIERQLGQRASTKISLPCPTDLDQIVSSRLTGSKEMLTVFHLKNHKLKNLQGMVAAMRKVVTHDPDIKLTVIGGGSAQDIAACRAVIGNSPNVYLAGPMDRAQLRERFQCAAGFVMPSLRESFGLVFVESLFAGLPIIYPEGRSVDGFFAKAPFAIKVPATNSSRIAEAILRLVKNETEAKQALAVWQESEEAHCFTRPAIADAFARGLSLAISS